jgi:hypothetical protein
MNLIGEPAFVGRHCGSSPYIIEKATIRFYQDALDDHHPLHDRFAPPLLYHSECYKFLGEWYLKNLFGTWAAGLGTLRAHPCRLEGPLPIDDRRPI